MGKIIVDSFTEMEDVTHMLIRRGLEFELRRQGNEWIFTLSGGF